MKTRQLNFQICQDILKDDFVCIRLFGSKFYRCPQIPAYIKENKEKHTEVVQVLNTLCNKKINGIWYFKFEDDDEKEDFLQTLLHMDMEPMMGEPDPEYYN